MANNMANKPLLIVENNMNGLSLNENASAVKDNKIILNGIFTEFDVKNRNERIYTKDKFLPHLNEMQGRMKTFGAVYGEFDHPDVFDTSLTRVSHMIHSISFNESANRIDGEIRLLKTPHGETAKSLVLDGCPIFVSSRAAGVTESDGTVSIKKLFTYDAVADPGFASAKMNLNVINESLGYVNESNNFRIIDMSDESKINEMFEMNDNDQKTKMQMVEFTEFLEVEIPKIKQEIMDNIQEGADPAKLDQLSEYYENLQANYTKMTKYLDYLAENVQILVSENEQLRDRTEGLIKHSDYLAENLEKSIDYSNYLAEKVDKSIDYSEYVAEQLSKSIDFSEYIAENLDKNIQYSDYLAETLDKSIDYTEYIAEHTEFNIQSNEMLSEYVDNSVKYTEYIAEQLDNNIQYSEYLAEHLDNNINYTEYIAEHVDNNIQYSEYIAENLADTQAYSKYIAESLDKTIDVVNGDNKINEDLEAEDQRISDLQVSNVDKYYEEENEEFPPVGDDEFEEPIEDEIIGDDVVEDEVIEDEVIEDEIIDDVVEDEVIEDEVIEDAPVVSKGSMVEFDIDGVKTSGEVLANDDGLLVVQVKAEESPIDIQADVQIDAEIDAEIDADVQAQAQAPVQMEIHESNVTIINKEEKIEVEEETVNESENTVEEDVEEENIFENETSIKNSISELILEAKKRKASEEQQPHFLLFLSDKNKENWAALSTEDKEKIVVAMNESTYTSETDVLNIIRESMTSSESVEDVLIKNIPNELLEAWGGLDDATKGSILSQARFYPDLVNSTAKMESFWNSRDLEKYNTNSKTLIKENKTYVDDVQLPDSEIEMYISKFKNL